MICEEFFGLNAGRVWKVLSERGELSVAQLRRLTSLSEAELFGALGWLAREGKLKASDSGRLTRFSLKH